MFDIYTGNAYRSDVMTLPGYSDPTYGELLYDNPELLVDIQVACLNGGIAKFDSL